VGNHTQTHPDMTTLPDDGIVAEVRGAERAILDVTGEDPRRFFRFPFGARTAQEIRIVNQLCYVAFRWTVDSLGWKGTEAGQSVQTVIARVRAAAASGAIVLMHVGGHPKDGSTLDADVLPTVIRMLRHAGYGLVPLSRVMPPDP
jgi:peptidoglycan/xylan/chitin deacetylase (PgdA/CDA1 family)